MRLALTFAVITIGSALGLLSDQKYLMAFGAGVILTMLIFLID